MTGDRPSLVTGVLGFVGRHLVPELLPHGPVLGIDRPRPGGPPPALGGFRLAGPAPGFPDGLRYEGPAGAWTFLPVDLLATEALREAVARCRPSRIVHLAAQSSAGCSFADPVGTMQVNVGGLQSLLEAVRALPPAERPRLLAIGSAEEYGPPREPLPLGERSPLRPVSPYGVSKAAATLLALQYHRAYGMHVLATRSFAHSGPGQDTRFAFPAFAEQIARLEAGGGEALLRVGDLSPVRDYLDVRDTTRAYRLLLESGAPGRVYNVCSGRPLTIREGLLILLRNARREFRLEVDPDRCRPADIPYLVGDGTQLRQRTGWRPERDFGETLGELLACARKDIR